MLCFDNIVRNFHVQKRLKTKRRWFRASAFLLFNSSRLLNPLLQNHSFTTSSVNFGGVIFFLWLRRSQKGWIRNSAQLIFILASHKTISHMTDGTCQACGPFRSCLSKSHRTLYFLRLVVPFVTIPFVTVPFVIVEKKQTNKQQQPQKQKQQNYKQR